MIDWIIAERIATYVAGTGEARVPQIDLVELVTLSERRVVEYTGLEPVRPLPPAEGVSRREWVASNVRSTGALLDPVMSRADKRLGPAGPAVQIAMGALLSLEVGLVIGYLAQRVLGQYELVLLDEAAEDHPPRLLFVLPNLGQALESFEADEREFMTWVTLHEVTHAVQFGGVPWLHRHLAGLVQELLKSAELRLNAKRRLNLHSRQELRRMGGALRSGDLISVVMNQSERETIDRVQAVMAVIEGHAEHVMDAVAPDLIPSLPRLRQALNARRRTQSRLSRIIGRLLGLELKLRQYDRGKQFCDAVAREGGEDALRHVFSGPEALPSLAEIEDPAAWLTRTAPARTSAVLGPGG